MPAASPPEVRVWKYIDRSDVDGCWNWTGHTVHNGYGAIRVYDKKLRAHRYVYELCVGPIPEGLQIDHLCRNRRCCNPKHMEPVTPRENTLRGDANAAVNARKTHCIRGHALSGDNLRIDGKGKRYCKTCRLEHTRESRRRAREESSCG